MATDLSSIEVELRRLAIALEEIFHELEKYKPREPRVIYLVVKNNELASRQVVFESEEMARDKAAGIPDSKVVMFVEVIE